MYIIIILQLISAFFGLLILSLFSNLYSDKYLPDILFVMSLSWLLMNPLLFGQGMLSLKYIPRIKNISSNRLSYYIILGNILLSYTFFYFILISTPLLYCKYEILDSILISTFVILVSYSNIARIRTQATGDKITALCILSILPNLLILTFTFIVDLFHSKHPFTIILLILNSSYFIPLLIWSFLFEKLSYKIQIISFKKLSNKKLFKESYILFKTNLSMSISNYYDTVILALILIDTEYAVYTIIARISSRVEILKNSIHFYCVPIISKSYPKKNENIFYRNFSKYSFLLLLIASSYFLSMIILKSYIFDIFKIDDNLIYVIVYIILLIANCTSTSTSLAPTSLNISGQHLLVSKIAIISLITTLVIIPTTGYFFGIVDASLSLLLVISIRSLIYLFLNHRKNKINYTQNKIVD